MALSLGSPPPAVNWHRVFVEPGLSSLKLIKAFQRRFRPESVNGNLDKECIIIAEKLSKIYS